MLFKENIFIGSFLIQIIVILSLQLHSTVMPDQDDSLRAVRWLIKGSYYDFIEEQIVDKFAYGFKL
jgi:hypothetical protein